MTDQYQAIIDQVKIEFPEDFEEILGNCTHLEILGEGWRVGDHHIRADGTVIIYKLKFPSKEFFTCVHGNAKEYSMKDQSYLDEIEVESSLVHTDEGRDIGKISSGLVYSRLRPRRTTNLCLAPASGQSN